MKQLKNSKCDNTQKLNIWQQNVTTLKSSIYDNSKTQNVTKLKYLKCDKNQNVTKPNNTKCDKSQKLKMWRKKTQKLKVGPTQNVTKI